MISGATDHILFISRKKFIYIYAIITVSPKTYTFSMKLSIYHSVSKLVNSFTINNNIKFARLTILVEQM